MEEQKKTTEVKMKPITQGNTNEKAQEKLSYEKLNEIAGQLYNENNYLKQQLKQASETLRMFNRLDYLLRIVEIEKNSGRWHFTDEFITRCMTEIETAMTPISTEEKEEDKGE